ncbi:HsdR family type I site-specific deoxyribonuclease [Micromonospora chalcea]|uniref:type I restriction endonuclease subunit R n=1 Tax=Micromonospora chalcea TaxID=1874 RepID=UPI00237963DD|nr:HsdR family type I site-specific deoxyribonuclease [Micromonospora chalcea]WDQ02212.1 HsdR family type I site-specific deoxyribonuclease [Micromonospora chalcea]
MAGGLEYSLVEKPLIEQLQQMGWRHLEGAAHDEVIPTVPAASGRVSFDEVILEDKLRAALRRINKNPLGEEWLTEDRISLAINGLTRTAPASLLDINRAATELLLRGVAVEGVEGWEGGKTRTIHFIDWHHLANNEFTVVNQFRVDIPGGRGPIVPDLVLFVNGIPLVVVECKKTTETSLNVAIGQIRRYAEQVNSEYRVGNQKLFHTVQLTVATSGEDARLGTFTAEADRYIPWRDPYPLTQEELASLRGKSAAQLSRQEILAAGVLDPANLLNIVHNYVTVMTTNQGKIVKVAPRYQQFRAVEKAIKRLHTGKTRRQDGAGDRRGGIIWHTQGSGKSITMTFLVRRLRFTPDLADFKVVVVTDRTQLQDQLSATMSLSGEMVYTARTASRARTLLGRRGPAVVFVMIQKNQAGDGVTAATSLGEVMNADESIVVLIDEAHRSHTASLGANLREALPNAARIGFTGTPIMTRKGIRKTSIDLFGPFIDTYRLREAEEDEVIVPILYEGVKVKAAVRDSQDLDDIFEDEFVDLGPEEREELQRRWVTKGRVSAARQLIDAKAKHMLLHYVDNVLPEGFKAQLVAYDREATVSYREALLEARDELVAAIEKLPPDVLAMRAEEIRNSSRARLVRAARHLDLLKRIDFLPVISKGEAENEHRLAEWSDETKQRDRIASFLRPFGENDTAFIIVRTMLLTGFDAPIAQAMYLDRQLEEHDLLQAVARVNRTAARKTHGRVVDYRGVARNLLEALRVFADEGFSVDEGKDVRGALMDARLHVAKLEPQAQRLRLMFRYPEDVERCVQALAEPELRDRFDAELARFARTVNTVLPDPAAKPYLPDLKRFMVIKLMATRRYRIDSGDFDPRAYGAKIRALIDEHIASLGIEQQLPPINMTAPGFAAKVEAMAGGPRAKASEMENAIRYHITVHRGEDPARYQKLSERLEIILSELKDDWDQQLLALNKLMEEIVHATPEDDSGLNEVEARLHRTMTAELATSPDDLDDPRFTDATRDLYQLATRTIHRQDFWRKTVDQEELRREIFEILYERSLGDYVQLDQLASTLLDVLKSNRRLIPKA